MKPTYLRVINYRTLKDVSIDLNFGAAAIIGPNGAGKSSFVESIMWAMYGDSRSELSDDVIRNGCEEVAVELHFEHEGIQYRIVRKRTRGGKADLQLMHFSTSEWLPLSASSMPETQKRINALLAMDSKLYQLTSYVGQDASAGICAAKPAERKEILYQIFEDQMKAFPGLQDAAKKAAKNLDGPIGIVNLDLPRCEQAQNDLHVANDNRVAALQDYNAAKLAMDASREKLDDLAEQAVVAERRAGVESRLAEIATQIQAENDKIAILDKNHTALLVDLEDARRTETEAVATVERLRAEASVHGDKYRQLVAIDERMHEKRGEYDKVMADIRQRFHTDSVKLNTTIHGHETDVQRLQGENTRLTSQRTDAAKRAGLLATVPCSANQGMQETCQLLQGARADADSLASLDWGIEEVGGQLAIACTKVEESRRECGELNTRFATEQTHAESDYKLVTAQIDTDRMNLGYDAAADAACKQTLRAAEAQQTGRVALLEGRVSTNRTVYGECLERGAALESQRVLLDRELATIPVVDADLPARRQQAAVDHERDLEAHRLYQRQLAQLDERISTLAISADKIPDLRQQLTNLDRKRTIYQLLAQAFGKDGIPALIIDSMVPALEASANDVLGQLSDGRMSIKFATLRGNKDGSIRETLDIIVTDAAGERAYANWSGGERLRINLAVRVALGEILAARQNAHIDHLILDEPCAPLDTAGEKALIECVIKLGKRFSPIFLLTHRETLSDCMPVQITVDKGVVKVA